MRNWKMAGIVLILTILLDLYVFQAVKTVTQGLTTGVKQVVFGIYWGISILIWISLIVLPMVTDPAWERAKSYIFFTIIAFFIAKLLAAVFFLADDIRRAILLLGHKGKRPDTGEPIPRSIFLSWLGLGVGTGLVSTLIYGFGQKYDYRIHRLQLAFDNLPPAFKGLKIIQLSDIHSGSLDDPNAVRKGVEMVLAEKADLILFTGDLVNNTADELEPFTGIFRQLKAPMGVYSTLGNHDYGDYMWWETPALKKANLERLMRMQTEMGWKLLMNEHVVLEREGDRIALIGIENWSAKARFPKHGKLKEAFQGAEQYPFKILMSHDPSHWDAEVRPHFPSIDLALAGHTHGMQFGIEIPGLKWSPVQFMYKQWAGLYEEGNQKLYVNRGFGFIGYPGRVGILPEITVIELV